MSCVAFLFENIIGLYTKNTLKALSKAQLIDLSLKMQDQTNFAIDFLMVDTKKMNNNSKRLECYVQFVSTVNNNLLKQIENTERQSWEKA